MVHPKSLEGEAKQKPTAQLQQTKQSTNTMPQLPNTVPEYKPSPALPKLKYQDLELNPSQTDHVLNKWNTPHFYLESDINLNNALSFIKETNSTLPEERHMTLDDLFIMASSNTCVDVPQSNSQFHGNFIRQFKNVNIAFMGYTGKWQTSLVIKNTNKMSLGKISKTKKNLTRALEEGNLDNYDTQGSTFTLSN